MFFCFCERLRLGFHQNCYPISALLCAMSSLWSLLSTLGSTKGAGTKMVTLENRVGASENWY